MDNRQIFCYGEEKKVRQLANEYSSYEFTQLQRSLMGDDFYWSLGQPSSVIYKLMIALSLILVALALPALTRDRPSTYLSPIIPPTAFIGQYYTCQFRVLGMDFPKYTFQGLPPKLTGNQNGRVVGTPEQIGSYQVTVSYSSNGYKSETEFVFMVVQKRWQQFQINSSVEIPPFSPLLIYLKENTTIFMFAEQIQLKVGAIGGKPPYLWTYVRMPQQLYGDKHGVVRGYFDTEGSYTFGVNCADSVGRSVDLFLTLNIQPMTFFGSYNIDPVYVNSMYPTREYNWEQLMRVQREMDHNYYYFYKEADRAKHHYGAFLIYLPEFQDAVIMAQKRVEMAVRTVNLSLSIHGRAVLKEAKAAIRFNISKDEFRLAQSARTNAKINFENAIVNFNQEDKVFNETQVKMRQVTNKFIEAQRERAYATQKYSQYYFEVENQNLQLNLTFETISSAKSILEKRKISLQNYKSTVNFQQNELNGAKMINDQAIASHNQAKNEATKTNDFLLNANLKVAEERVNQQISEEALGVAKFNLQRKMNDLKVAQARKEQADRLVMMTSMYEADREMVQFGGCSQEVYPSMSGSAIVTKIFEKGVHLSSGHTIKWGSCTQTTLYSEGDLLFFNGYLKRGCIHALSLTKFSQQ